MFDPVTRNKLQTLIAAINYIITSHITDSGALEEEIAHSAIPQRHRPKYRDHNKGENGTG